MSYDETLARRVRQAVGSLDDIVEKEMFGGLAFLLGGRMFCGVVGDDVMVRIGLDAARSALRKPHVRPMDFTGRPMAGYVFVGSAGTRTLAQVSKWALRAADYVAALPVDPPRPKKTRPPQRLQPPRRQPRS